MCASIKDACIEEERPEMTEVPPDSTNAEATLAIVKCLMEHQQAQQKMIIKLVGQHTKDGLVHMGNR